MITANRSFSGWDDVFPDKAMSIAAIDRLVHHATIFEINVESCWKLSSPSGLYHSDSARRHRRPGGTARCKKNYCVDSCPSVLVGIYMNNEGIIKMFVQNLNERQQSALLYYADEVMRADGKIHAEELLEMEELRKQVQSSVIAEEINLSALPSLFKRRLSRVSFLLELIGMGYANKTFEPAQAEIVHQIAEAFDFHEDGTIEAIEKWVKDQLDLMEQAKLILGEE